ncbi:MAG: hypothetical protein JNK56_27285 [Myxococcales bacterium]|nr:hypothetical protein [Myxococcales bacterium]
MNASQLLDRLLPRWRARLGAAYSPAYIDGFIRRHREALEELVAQVLRQRSAEGGETPETAEEFAAYDPVVARERKHDAGTDKAVLERLMQQIDADFRAGYREQLILVNFGLEYVETRAEAIVLRSYGWDAVPLQLDRPALAVIAANTTVALRDSFGRLAIHPTRRGTLNHLHTDMFKVEAKVQHLSQEINLPRDTKERLGMLAKALWKRARATTARRDPRSNA